MYSKYLKHPNRVACSPLYHGARTFPNERDKKPSSGSLENRRGTVGWRSVE